MLAETIFRSLVSPNLEPGKDISWQGIDYEYDKTAFTDIASAEFAVTQNPGYDVYEITVLAGDYSMQKLSNYATKLNVYGLAYPSGATATATVNVVTFENTGAATFDNASLVATGSVINDAGKTITFKNGAFVNATFTGAGTVILGAGGLADGSQILGGANDVTVSAAMTLGGATKIVADALVLNKTITLTGTASLEAATADLTSKQYILVQGDNKLVLPSVTTTGIYIAVNAEGATLHESTVGGTVSFGKNTNLLGANTIGSINLQGKAIDDPSGNYKKLTIGNGSDATSLTTKMVKLGVSSADTKGYLDINNATVTIKDNAGTTEEPVPNGQLLVAKGSLVNIMGDSKVNVDIVHLPSQINVDVLSTITVTDAIYGYGSGIINVDTTAITGTTEKLYTVVKGDLDNVDLYIDGELFDGNPVKGYNVITIGDQGVFLTTESQSNLFVSSEYSDDKIGTLVNGHLVGYNAFSNLADAAKAAPVGTESTITVSGTGKIVAASAFGGGQNVTITGEASFDWGEDWMYVGRNAAQGDVTQLAKVTFKDATITRTTHTPDNSDRSINISGAENGSETKGYGQVDFDNSTVTTEWVINKNVLNVMNGSELTVTTSLNVAGRPAEESLSGEDDTAVLNVDSSTVDVLGSMTIGNEGNGEVNLTNGAELNAKSITATAKSEINVTNSTVSVDEKFNNAGTVNVTGVSKISAAEYTGDLTLGKLGETTTVTTDGLKATSGNVLIADGGTVAMNGNGFDLHYVRDSKVRDNDEEHVGYTLNIGNADLFKAYALYSNGASVINVDNVKDIESWYFNIYGGTLNLNGTDKTAFKAGVVDNGNITGSLNVTKTTLDLATLNVLAAPAEKHAGEVKATGAVIDVRFTNIGTEIVENKKYAAGTSQTASLELDGSTLIVKNIAGEPTLGSITVGGDEATAGTLTMKNGSAVVQKFTDSEASHYRSAQFVVGKNGLVDIDKSSVTMDIVNNAGTIDVAGEGVINAKTLTNTGTINVTGNGNTISGALTGTGAGSVIFTGVALDNKISLTGSTKKGDNYGGVRFLGTSSIVNPTLTAEAKYYVGTYGLAEAADSALTINGDVTFNGITYVGADDTGATGKTATLDIAAGKTLTVTQLYARASSLITVNAGSKLLSGYGNLQGTLTVNGGVAQFTSVGVKHNMLASAENGGVLDLGYTESQDADRHHTYSLSDGSILTVGPLYNTNIAISMDTSSTLALAPLASQVAEGTKLAITIDTDDYDGGIVKLIDMNAKYNYETKKYETAGYNVKMTVDDYKRIVTNWDKNFKVIDNDLYISDISADTVYVNTEWTSTSELPEGMYYGINAFSSMQDATVAANANGGSTIEIYKITTSGLNAKSKFTVKGEYTITGGNVTDLPAMALYLNGEESNVSIENATLTTGKIRGGEDDNDEIVSNKFAIEDSIIGVVPYANSTAWMTFYGTSMTVDNSIVGAKLNNAYYAEVADMPRSASDVQAAVKAGTLKYIDYGASLSGMNFGTGRDLTVTESTMSTGYFDATGHALITLDDSLVYLGGCMTVGQGKETSHSFKNVVVPEYRTDEAATIELTNGSIIRNIGYGNGNEGVGLRIGDMFDDGADFAGVVKVTGKSQLLMDFGNNDSNAKISVYRLGTLDINGDSIVTGRNVTNAGTINVGIADDKETTDKDESSAGTLTATTLTNSGAINAYAGSTITTTGLFTNDNEVVLDGTTLTTNGIVNNASFKATDSVIDGGGQGGSPHITNGLGGTMELTNSTITTGAFIINSYGTSISLDNSTLDARIINSKEITAVDSTIISTDLRNEGGKFVVSGDSTLNVKLTNGTIDLENATLTATTVTGAGNLSIAAQYVVTPAVEAVGEEGQEGYVPAQAEVKAANVVTFKGSNTVNAITNNGTLALVGIPGTPAVEAVGEEGDEGYVPAQAAIPAEGAFTAGAIINNGTITIDNLSSISATSIAGGTIELTDFANNATRPVITVNSTDFTAAVKWTYKDSVTGVEKTYTLDGATTYTDDNKFLVQKSVTETATTISVVKVSEGKDKFVVSKEWDGLLDGTVVEGYDGKEYVVGFNAFNNLFNALENRGATTSTIVVMDSNTYYHSDADLEFYLTHGLEVITVGDANVVQTVDLKAGKDFVWATTEDYSAKDKKFTVTLGKGVTLKTTSINPDTGETVVDAGGVIYNGFLYIPNFDIYGTLDANSTLWIGSAWIDSVSESTTFNVYSTGRLKGQQFCIHDMANITVNGFAVDPENPDAEPVRLTETQVAMSYTTLYSGTITLNNTTMTNANWTSINNAYGSYIEQRRTWNGSFLVLDNSALTSGSYLQVNGVNSDYPDYLGKAGLTLKNGSILKGNGTGTDGGNNTVTGSQSFIELSGDSTLDLVKNLTVTDGTVTSEASTIIIGGTLTNNNGTITVSGESTLTASKITNSGSFIATGAADAKATVSAAIDNDVNATVEMTDVVFNKITDSVNKGEWTVKDSSLTTYSVTNYDAKSTFSAEDSTITMTRITNNGSFDVDGGAINTKKLENAGIFTLDAAATLDAADVANNGTITLFGASKLLSTNTITGTGTLKFDGATINNAIEAAGNKGVFTGTNAINADLNFAKDNTSGEYYQGYGNYVNTADSKVTVTNATVTAKNFYIGNDQSDGVTDTLILNNSTITSPAPQDNTALYVRGNGVVQANDASTIGRENAIFNIMDYGDVTLTGGDTEATRTKAYFDGFVVYGVDLDDNPETLSSAAFTATNADITVRGTLDGAHCNQYTVGGLTTAVLVGGKSGKGDGTLTLTDSTFTVGTNLAIGFVEDGSVSLLGVNSGAADTVVGSTLTVTGTIGVGLGAGTGTLTVDATSTVTANSISVGANGTIDVDGEDSSISFKTGTNRGSIALTNGAELKSSNNIFTYGSFTATDSTVSAPYFMASEGTVELTDSDLSASQKLENGAEFTMVGGNLKVKDLVSKENGNFSFTLAEGKKFEAATITNKDGGTVALTGDFTAEGVLSISALEGELTFAGAQINGLTLADEDSVIAVVDTANSFTGKNHFANLTVEGALTIDATQLTIDSGAFLFVDGDFTNTGSITIDATGVDFGSVTNQLQVISVTGDVSSAAIKVIDDGAVSTKYMAVVKNVGDDRGVYLVKGQGPEDTKIIAVNSEWSEGVSLGAPVELDGDTYIFGMNAFAGLDDLTIFSETTTLKFAAGTYTGNLDLTGTIVNTLTVVGEDALGINGSLSVSADLAINGAITTASLDNDGKIYMDWKNLLTANTLEAADNSIVIDLSHDLETVGEDTAVIATTNVSDFSTIVADYALNADIFKVVDGDLKLDAAAIGKVFSSAKTGIGYFTTVADAVADGDTKLILIDSNALVDGKVENVYLRSKRGVVLSSAGQISRSVFAGGYDVSTLDGVKYRPFSDNYKHVGEEDAEESTNVTINGGTYNGYVIGADMILLDTADKKETNVLFYRTGNSNVTINAGDFKASANGVRAIAGGMMYAISGSGKTGRAGLVGNVNLTITGGTFYGFNVYGGNYANNNKNYGTFTSIEGNITVTLDASKQKLVFEKNSQATGIITAGSYGPSSVDGSTKIVLTGSNGIEFQQLIGGCSGDIYSKDTTTGKWVNESLVTGSRTLSFTGFYGDLDFANIHGFNTVSFEGANEINFDGEFHRYFNDEVTNWNFAADSEVTGSLSFDFLGDALNLDDFTTGGWELSNVSMDAATTVSFDGELATGNIEDGWTNAAGTLALSFDSEANKLSLASINIG